MGWVSTGFTTYFQLLHLLLLATLKLPSNTVFLISLYPVICLLSQSLTPTCLLISYTMWVCAQLCPTLLQPPWTVACQAPLSMKFSRQEYWSGLPFPSPGDLPNPGIKPGSPTLEADSLLPETPGKPLSYTILQPKHRHRSHPATLSPSGSHTPHPTKPALLHLPLSHFLFPHPTSHMLSYQPRSHTTFVITPSWHKKPSPTGPFSFLVRSPGQRHCFILLQLLGYYHYRESPDNRLTRSTVNPSHQPGQPPVHTLLAMCIHTLGHVCTLSWPRMHASYPHVHTPLATPGSPSPDSTVSLPETHTSAPLRALPGLRGRVFPCHTWLHPFPEPRKPCSTHFSAVSDTRQPFLLR